MHRRCYPQLGRAPVAAVSISAPVTRMDEATMDRLLPKLLATVEEISRMLGYAPS